MPLQEANVLSLHLSESDQLEIDTSDCMTGICMEMISKSPRSMELENHSSMLLSTSAELKSNILDHCLDIPTVQVCFFRIIFQNFSLPKIIPDAFVGPN
jgi:hypothetical protein